GAKKGCRDSLRHARGAAGAAHPAGSSHRLWRSGRVAGRTTRCPWRGACTQHTPRGDRCPLVARRERTWMHLVARLPRPPATDDAGGGGGPLRARRAKRLEGVRLEAGELLTVVHVTLYTPAMLHENRYARYP